MLINQVNDIRRNVIRGLSPGELLKETSAHILESVRPECAILYPEVRSDIGVISDNVMLENRSDVDNLRIIRLNQVESGNDANFDIDNHKSIFVYEK